MQVPYSDLRNRFPAFSPGGQPGLSVRGRISRRLRPALFALPPLAPRKRTPDPSYFSSLSLPFFIQADNSPYHPRVLSCPSQEHGFNFLNRLLAFDPEKRLTAKKALEHSWFNESPVACERALMPTYPARSTLAELARDRRKVKSPDPIVGMGMAKSDSRLGMGMGMGSQSKLGM